MYQLKYDETNQQILQIDPNGKETIIEDNFPSTPVFSPNNKYAIFISPLEWECIGSLYLYELESGHKVEIVPPNQNVNPDIPKYAIWIDNECIALIIGFSMGTVSIGGNVFTYNIRNKQLSQITHYEPKIQITKIEYSEIDILILTGIAYIDDHFDHYVEYTDNIQLTKE